MNPPGRNEVLIRNPERDSWFRFSGPGRVLSAADHDGVLPLLREVEQAVEAEGFAAAGFIAYEAAPAFDPALGTHDPAGFPLAWFLLTRTFAEVEDAALPGNNGEGAPLCWTATVTEDEYRAAVRRIRSRIADGDTYQVNYSYRMRSPYAGDPFALFRRMTRAQKTPYGAYIDAGRYVVCSASPELFFSLNGRRLTSRPMKGTAPRGLTQEDDRERGDGLQRSEKDRAENVMIVDMMRNDIGRVAGSGTVRVPELFALEKYPTVWQLTSSVEAETDAPLTEILRALFPAASITGAPKPRTMEIIRELESTPRRIYTGAIGMLFPGRKAAFTVAIRTALVDRDTGMAEYGVGGGIVWNSTEEGEFVESRTKALLVTEPAPEFSLLATLLWSPEEGYLYIDEHINRMSASARYFDFSFAAGSARRQLDGLARTLRPLPHKVRLLADREGLIRTEAEPWSPPAKDALPVVRLARSAVLSSDRFLYHKTTHRRVYERALLGSPGCEDVILWNERGELTESTIANLLLEMDGIVWTPPVQCGLLPGVARARLLKEGKIREAVLTRPDLARSPRVFLVNSVRGVYEVRVSEGDG